MHTNVEFKINKERYQWALAIYLFVCLAGIYFLRPTLGGWVVLVSLGFLAGAMIRHRGDKSMIWRLAFVPVAYLVSIALWIVAGFAVGLVAGLNNGDPSKLNGWVTLLANVPIVAYALTFSRYFAKPSGSMGASNQDNESQPQS